MSAAGARPPVPPPSRSARHPHSHRPPRPCRPSLAAVARPSARSRGSIRPPLHLLAVPDPRTCHCPLRPCRPSIAAVARPYARLCDCVRPPLHLLAVPVTRTRTVLLAVSVSSARARPPVPPPPSQYPSLALARVGRMPGLALHGFLGEESELEEIELVASEGSGSDNEEDGPGPP